MEDGALVFNALGPYPALQVVDQPAGHGQAQAQTAESPGFGPVGLGEILEQVCQVLGGNPHPVSETAK